MLRRLCGILVMLLLANASVARAAVTCASEPSHLLQGEPGHPASHGDAHAEHDLSPPESERIPTPEPSECCQAMTSCAIAGDLTAAEAHAPPATGADEVSLIRAVEPSSRTAAPETPPPRD